MKVFGAIIITVLLGFFSVTLAGPGDLLWSYQTEDTIRSSPAIASDGTIYFGSYDNYLYALDPDGNLVWRFETGDKIRSSPAVCDDGTIYVGSYDSCLYAINPDGTQKWRYKTDGSIYSSPAIGSDGSIYVGSLDNYLYAFNPDSTLKWSFQTDGDIYSSPSIGEDGTIYFGSYDSTLYALNAEGNVSWEYEASGEVRSSPAIADDGTVYFTSPENFYSLNPDGTERWIRESSHWSPIIAPDGSIFVGGDIAYYPDGEEKASFGTIPECHLVSVPVVGSDSVAYISYYCTSFGGAGIYALSPIDFEQIWDYDEVTSTLFSPPNISAEGDIIFGADDGILYAIESESQGLPDVHWPKFRHDSRNTGRIGPGTGIEELPNETSEIDIYTTSISDKFQVFYNLTQGRSGMLQVFDVSGQLVSAAAVSSSGEVDFNESLTRGVYFVKLVSQGQTRTVRIILK